MIVPVQIQKTNTPLNSKKNKSGSGIYTTRSIGHYLHKHLLSSNPNNPVVILRFAILPIEGAVLFELAQLLLFYAPFMPKWRCLSTHKSQRFTISGLTDFINECIQAFMQRSAGAKNNDHRGQVRPKKTEKKNIIQQGEELSYLHFF